MARKRYTPETIIRKLREAEVLQGQGNYQTLINDALRRHIEEEAQPLEDTLRRVIREELTQAG